MKTTAISLAISLSTAFANDYTAEIEKILADNKRVVAELEKANNMLNDCIETTPIHSIKNCKDEEKKLETVVSKTITQTYKAEPPNASSLKQKIDACVLSFEPLMNPVFDPMNLYYIRYDKLNDNINEDGESVSDYSAVATPKSNALVKLWHQMSVEWYENCYPVMTDAMTTKTRYYIENEFIKKYDINFRLSSFTYRTTTRVADMNKYGIQRYRHQLNDILIVSNRDGIKDLTLGNTRTLLPTKMNYMDKKGKSFEIHLGVIKNVNDVSELNYSLTKKAP